MGEVETRLKQLGIVLPAPVTPIANYVPFRRAGHLLLISGQIAIGADGKLADNHRGKLGKNIFHESGLEAARLCAINILAQAKAALGNLDHIRACLRLGGFINCVPDFAALPAVMNGASDLMVEALGEKGRHARTTVGVAQLPMDCAVEVEAMFEID